MKRAALYTDTQALCEWLFGHLGDDPRVLARALCEHALALHTHVVLALGNRRREEHIDRADEDLVALRAQVRLATRAGYFTEDQLVHAMERADTIGRQLGGWLKSLGPM